ncbi:MAG TPA: hypothetical protein VMV89_09655, partial [Candidatus Paceibacterota bacterium]|nr:hypothetical protein [Candidatus Paceibacterota bacterium]
CETSDDGCHRQVNMNFFIMLSMVSTGQFAGTPNRRWRWQFRYRGSRRKSAVAQLSPGFDATSQLSTSRPVKITGIVR